MLDTNAERDYLIEKIYPRLKEYCKKNFDLDFQVETFYFDIKFKNSLFNIHSSVLICDGAFQVMLLNTMVQLSFV